MSIQVAKVWWDGDKLMAEPISEAVSQVKSRHLAALRDALANTSPPARKPLTDARIDEAIQQHVDPFATYRKLHDFARAIEAAKGIKES